MSIESATQRISEIQAMIAGGPMASSTSAFGATAAPNSGFADQLAMAQGTGDDGGENATTMLSPGDQGQQPYPFNTQFPGVGGVVPGQQIPGEAGARIVQLAQNEIGVKESPPGSNDSPRIHEYRTATAGAANTPGPWCAYFVSWLCKQAGAPVGENGQGTGYVPTLESWGKKTGRWIEHGTAPQPGDIVIFDRGADGVADHTGIVERVDGDGTVHTIEGNSSDQVTRHDYTAGDGTIAGYVRPS